MELKSVLKYSYALGYSNNQAARTEIIAVSVFVGVALMIIFDIVIFCLTLGRTIYIVYLDLETRRRFTLQALIIRDGMLSPYSFKELY